LQVRISDEEAADPDPHLSEKLDPDPHQSESRIWIRIKMESRIWIRIKMKSDLYPHQVKRACELVAADLHH
jgi:hypothetical protein